MLVQSDLARFIGALVCAAFGVWLALAISCNYFALDATTLSPSQLGSLAWATQSWGKESGYLEDREKGLFVLSLLLGGLGGYIGARWSLGRRLVTIQAALVLALYVPLMSRLIGLSMVSTGRWAMVYATVGASALVVAALLLRSGPLIPQSVLPTNAPAAGPGPSAPGFFRTPSLPDALKAALGAATGIGVFVVLLWPLDVDHVARSIGYELHYGFFMVGAATYRFSPDLIPGIDYYNQYSVGIPWVFSYFLSPRAAQTMINAVWFVLGAMVIFQISLFFFLWWFLRSWGWAIVVAIGVMLTQFTSADPLFAPSSTAIRYPLVILVASALVLWVRRGLGLATLPVLGLALAAALFTNTETGSEACVAVAVATLGVCGMAEGLRRGALLAVATFIGFMLLCFIAYGRGVFDYHFLFYLFEPMLLFAAGFEAESIQWLGGWYWFYYIVAPGVALASIGWAIVSARSERPPAGRDQLAALIFVAILGLLMSTKFINQSALSLWQVNCWAFIVVMAWWARRLLEPLGERYLLRRPVEIVLQPLAASLLGALLFIFLCDIHSRRDPYHPPVRAYRTFPSPFNWLFGVRLLPCEADHRPGCTAYAADPADVALIDRLTRPGDRVALIDWEDWVYLVAAERSSQFPTLPSPMMFTQRQLQRSFCKDLELLFLSNASPDTFGLAGTEAAPILVPDLKANFELAGTGKRLSAWRRVRPSSGPRSSLACPAA
jgi:hypothetical protein